MGFFKKTKKRIKQAVKIAVSPITAPILASAGAVNQLTGGRLSGIPGVPDTAVGGLKKSLGIGNRRGIDDPTQVDFTDPNIAAQEEARKEADKRKKRAGARVLTSPLSRLVEQSKSTRVLTGQ